MKRTSKGKAAIASAAFVMSAPTDSKAAVAAQADASRGSEAAAIY